MNKRLLFLMVVVLVGLIISSYAAYLKSTIFIQVKVHDHLKEVRLPEEIKQTNDCDEVKKWIKSYFSPHTVSEFKCPFGVELDAHIAGFNINNIKFRIPHDIINEDEDMPPGSENFFVKIKVNYPKLKKASTEDIANGDELQIKLISTYFYEVCRKDQSRCIDLWQDDFYWRIAVGEKEYRNKDNNHPMVVTKDIINKVPYKNYDIFLLTTKTTEKDLISRQVDVKTEANYFIKGSFYDLSYWLWCEDFENLTSNGQGNCKSSFNLNDKILVEYNFKPKYLAKHWQIRESVNKKIKELQAVK